MNQQEMTEFLLGAFKNFDADGNGHLDPSEMKKCLESLTLPTSLTDEPPKLGAREVNTIMAYLDADENGYIEYNEFAPLMFNWMVEAFKLGFMRGKMSELEEYLARHFASFDAARKGVLSRKDVKRAFEKADLLKPALSQVQILALLADASFDDSDCVDYQQFLTQCSPLVQSMCDPVLEYKRKEVVKRAQIQTPLQALTPEERDHLRKMVSQIFVGYDADQSGRLEFAEFRKCLNDSQLGLSEKQISYLMSVSDADADGSIDYQEFQVLFFEALVELARMEAIERELLAEDAANTAGVLLDPSQLMIPLHILFDLMSDGSDEIDAPKLAEALAIKAEEWGAAGIELIVAKVAAKEALTWSDLTELLVEFAPTAPEEKAADAPTGEGAPPAEE